MTPAATDLCDDNIAADFAGNLIRVAGHQVECSRPDCPETANAYSKRHRDSFLKI
jgi:hypothetical protein